MYQNFEIKMMSSLCLQNFKDFAHGQIHSSGSLDLE